MLHVWNLPRGDLRRNDRISEKPSFMSFSSISVILQRPTWIAWRYHMRGLLYWGGMSFWDHVEDPWTDPKTYNLRKKGKGKEPIYNGEGSIVYPGRPAGYDGIASSLRLKALRDSIEDYEYLAILERLGRTAEAEKIVLPLAESFFRWDPDPGAYDAARAKLAELIQSSSAHPGAPRKN